MNATTIPQATGQAWRTREPLVVYLRPAREADAAAIARLAEHGATVCLPGECREQPLERFHAGHQPGVLAVTEDEEVVGIAWLEIMPFGPAEIGVVVVPRYRREGGVAELIHELMAEAVRHGHHEVATKIAPGLPDPLRELRDGGLRVISAFTTGGISDVHLALD